MSSRQPLQTFSAQPLQIPVTDSDILVSVLRPLSYPGLHDPHKQLPSTVQSPNNSGGKSLRKAFRALPQPSHQGYTGALQPGSLGLSRTLGSCKQVTPDFIILLQLSVLVPFFSCSEK